MTVFTPWRPCIRIEPSVQLEYRHPLLLREQYTGPAVADASVAECDSELGNTTEAEENREKAGPRV